MVNSHFHLMAFLTRNRLAVQSGFQDGMDAFVNDGIDS